MSVTIYGASDDLIEVDGDIYEEFSGDFADGVYVYTSAGHVFRFRLEAEGWSVRVLMNPDNNVTVKRGEGDLGPDSDDRVTVETNLSWVVATKMPPATVTRSAK